MNGELRVYMTMLATREDRPWAWTIVVAPQFEIRSEQSYKTEGNAARAGRAAARALGITVPRRRRSKCTR